MTDQSSVVQQLAAIGESPEAIAATIGCSAAELRQRYTDELRRGPTLRRAEIIEGLFGRARAGSVPAMMALLRRMDAAEVAEASPASANVRSPRVGKKLAALEAARTAGAGTDWGDDLEIASDREPRGTSH